VRPRVLEITDFESFICQPEDSIYRQQGHGFAAERAPLKHRLYVIFLPNFAKCRRPDPGSPG
jgi:hypothetical protein